MCTRTASDAAGRLDWTLSAAVAARARGDELETAHLLGALAGFDRQQVLCAVMAAVRLADREVGCGSVNFEGFVDPESGAELLDAARSGNLEALTATPRSDVELLDGLVGVLSALRATSSKIRLARWGRWIVVRRTGEGTG